MPPTAGQAWPPRLHAASIVTVRSASKRSRRVRSASECRPTSRATASKDLGGRHRRAHQRRDSPQRRLLVRDPAVAGFAHPQAFLGALARPDLVAQLAVPPRHDQEQSSGRERGRRVVDPRQRRCEQHRDRCTARQRGNPHCYPPAHRQRVRLTRVHANRCRDEQRRRRPLELGQGANRVCHADRGTQPGTHGEQRERRRQRHPRKPGSPGGDGGGTEHEQHEDDEADCISKLKCRTHRRLSRNAGDVRKRESCTDRAGAERRDAGVEQLARAQLAGDPRAPSARCPRSKAP